MKYCYLLLFTLVSHSLAAQFRIPITSYGIESNSHTSLYNDGHYCATDLLRQRMAERRAALMTEQQMDNVILNSFGNRDNELLYIPVVVHIIHNKGDENITDTQVLQGIQHMNDVFANSGAYYSPDGFDMGIRFCLAEQTPEGLSTTGVTKHNSVLCRSLARQQSSAV